MINREAVAEYLNTGTAYEGLNAPFCLVCFNK